MSGNPTSGRVGDQGALPGPRLGSTIARTVIAVALLGAGVLVWMHQLSYRGWEAWAAGHTTQLLGGGRVLVNRGHALMFIDANSPKIFGLVVTPECTSTIVTLGVCAVTAFLILTSRIRLHRLMVAALAAAAAFFLFNLIRLVGIALATRQWGLGAGFHWSHVWGGTFITVFGGVGACVLYMMMLGMRLGGAGPRSKGESA